MIGYAEVSHRPYLVLINVNEAKNADREKFAAIMDVEISVTHLKRPSSTRSTPRLLPVTASVTQITDMD